MNIVTIMNYDWSIENNFSLCYTWIYYANKFLSKLDTVYIYSEKPLCSIFYEQFANSNCTFKSVVVPRCKINIIAHFSPQHTTPISNHNFFYKLYTTCSIPFPFLFIDCDALIVNKIDELENIFYTTKNQVFFIDHETNIPKQTSNLPLFINSGVFIMNDPFHKIYNWEKIIDYSQKIGFFPIFKENGLNIPGTDQAIIKSYLDNKKYNYRHPDFDNRYNATHCMIDNSKIDYYKIIHYWGTQKEKFPYINT